MSVRDINELTVRANGLVFSCLELGEGPLVLCMHGFPDTASTWTQLMPRVAALGYRVVAPNMRGYAPTQLPDDDDYRVWTFGQDVLSLIAALGHERAVIIGHDWGASAVYSAVAQAPEKIDRLIALAIPPPSSLRPTLSNAWAIRHFVSFQLRGRTLARYRRDPLGFLRGIYKRWSPRWEPDDAEFADVIEAFAQPGSLEAAFHYYWTFFKDARSRETRRLNTTRITVPTLLLGGDADILSVDNWEWVGRAFDAPYEVEIVRGAGHFLHRERPEEVASLICDWLGAPA